MKKKEKKNVSGRENFRAKEVSERRWNDDNAEMKKNIKAKTSDEEKFNDEKTLRKKDEMAKIKIFVFTLYFQ